MSVEHAPSWELYEAFLHVMREGSFSGAARALGMAQPTVRRRVVALEAQLGSALFSRSRNGLVSTELARRLAPFAETMEATSRSILRAASGEPDRVEGVVRVAASDLVGVEFLPSVFEALRRTHPGISIELALSNAFADVARRDVDLAVRMARPEGASLVARRLGQVTLGFHAARAYLEGRPLPEELADLRTHRLVGYDRNPQLLEGLAALGLELRPEDFEFRTDHDLAYLSAMRSGLGIGVTHVRLAERLGLVRVLPDHGLPVELWLVAHEDLRKVRRIRVVLEHLADALADYVD